MVDGGWLMEDGSDGYESKSKVNSVSKKQNNYQTNVLKHKNRKS
jgi:hypothetical protein